MLLRSLLRATAAPLRQSQWQLTNFRSMASETPTGGSSKVKKPQAKFDKKTQSKSDLKEKKPEEVQAASPESIAKQDAELRRRLLAEDEKNPALDVGPDGRPLFTSAPSLSLLTKNDINHFFRFSMEELNEVLPEGLPLGMMKEFEESCRSALLVRQSFIDLRDNFRQAADPSLVAKSRGVSTLLTKKACIDLVKNCKSFICFKQIHAQVFTHGLHSNIDVLHKLMVFASDADLRHADRIFAQIEHPTLFIYNVMIKAHVKFGSCRKSLSLFDELRLRGLVPDNYTYPFVFKAAGRLRMILEGEKIHGFALKSGIFHDCYVCNSVLDLYGELGCPQNLAKVFDEIPTRDLISWNVLISGFVKSSRFEDAVNVYRRIRLEASVQPDEATVVSTLSACTALKNLDLGREIHEYVGTKLGFTMIIRNALLDMYAKCGCLEIAQEIFDAMPEKNVICWTSMVSAHANFGRLDEARALFERSPVKDLVLWTAMINGYVQFNKVDEAMTLFRCMQMDGVKPDKYTLVTLLTGCAQLGVLEQGEWIHGYLKESGIIIDAVVGTALIEMYAKCGCIEKSLQIFYQLNQKDTASWTHGGLVEEGRMHFNSMTKVYGIEPKLEHFGCLIDLLGRAGLLEEAEELIRKVPNQDNKFMVPLYGAVLSACRNYGNVEMGERIAKQLLKMESNDSSCHTLLSNIYAAANRWEDVKEVRRRMIALAPKSLPGCSALEIANCNMMRPRSTLCKLHQRRTSGIKGEDEKSIVLAMLVNWARKEGWLVLYVPRGRDWTHGGVFYKNPETSLWDTPVQAVNILRDFLKYNKACLEGITRKIFDPIPLGEGAGVGWQKGRDKMQISEGTTLCQLVEAGLQDTHAAVGVVVRLRKELSKVTSVPVLIAIDQYNNWFTFTDFEEAVTDRSFRPIHAREVTTVNAFRSMMHDDMMVGAFSHSTAVGKLRQELPDVPPDARTFLPRYSLDEAATVCHYYLRQRLVKHDAFSEENWKKIFYLSNGNGTEMRYLVPFMR
ncbi:Pentatricopeptide repeat superfamily protein [Perilla frutescens var. frutescens]|nr:Pentatricopeptide repeat superfamily protein [Perilla frutescens var. frutescens]